MVQSVIIEAATRFQLMEDFNKWAEDLNFDSDTMFSSRELTRGDAGFKDVMDIQYYERTENMETVYGMIVLVEEEPEDYKPTLNALPKPEPANKWDRLLAICFVIVTVCALINTIRILI